MSPRAHIWNILHDGGIVALDGEVPGSVTMRVNIPYLRKMFSADGEDIIVLLRNCTKLTMKMWEDDFITHDFKRITEAGAEILSTESDDIPVHVHTTLGELDVAFEEFSLSLDNGRQISFSELGVACADYWDRWSKGSSQDSSAELTE